MIREGFSLAAFSCASLYMISPNFIESCISASVFSKDCFIADAYATAFMVLDFNKAKEISKKIQEIDVFLVYKDSLGNINTYVSPNLSELIDIRK